MNSLELLRDILTGLAETSPWTVLLAKTTLLLAAAWAVHFCLAGANPRWRILLWRGAVLGLALIAIWTIDLPGLEFRLQSSAPVAAAPAATISPASDQPPVVATEPIRHVRAFHEAPEAPAPDVTTAPVQQPRAADREEAVAPPSPRLSWPVMVLGVWCIGVALLLVRLAIGYVGLVKLLRRSEIVSEELSAEVKQIAAALDCRRSVDVRSSRQTTVPFMFGLWRPVLVLPERMCQAAYRRELPGVVAHELTHVTSHDFAWNTALRAASILLWFHPLTWRIGSAHRAACDAVCDAVAASYLGNVAAYCRTLAQVALDSAAPLPGLGLAMARTCDVRRRIAALQRRVFAATLSRRAVAAAAAVGLVSSALLASARLIRAEAPTQSIAAATSANPAAKDTGGLKGDSPVFADHSVVPAKTGTVPNAQPVSMSADDFGRLSAAEQRALLVREFQRRLAQAQNLYYEVEETQRLYENDHGKPGKLRKDDLFFQSRYRHWRLGDSFRCDQVQFTKVDAAEPSHRRSYAFNAAEGVARNTSTATSGKTGGQGQVQYPTSDTGGDFYIHWFDPKGREIRGDRGDYIFPYLIQHQGQLEIKAPVEGGKVELTVPWYLPQTIKPWGKRVYVLDPQKAFLPIRCDSHWEADAVGGGKPPWGTETMAVQESRLVGGIWLPTDLTTEAVTSFQPGVIVQHELKVLRIEPGAAKSGDFFIPFSAGMFVMDTIEGATYTADAKGNPVNPKVDPNWKSKPPAGWTKHPSSMLSNYSAADRAKLDAQWKALDDKNGRDRKAYEAALKVMQSSAPLDDRIEAGLNALRRSPIEVDNDFKPWASVMRELIELGKPAVPKLTAELDRTEQGRMLCYLGFVLRGIGDPRAAPALIRAIPRIPGGGDYGFNINGDPKLLRFMLEHDNAHLHKPVAATIGPYDIFSLGSPIREIMPALEKLVGGIGGWHEFRFANRQGGREQQRLQRKAFLQLAQRWADWWSKNWPKYVKNEEEAQLDQTTKTFEQLSRALAAPAQPPAMAFPTGPNVVADGGSIYTWTPSFDESPADGLLDLDTGRHPNPPADLVKGSTGHEPSPALLAWAEKEGVDLVCMKVKASDGAWHYAWKPLSMKVWRIENSRFDRIEKELREIQTPKLPPPSEGLLAQIDEKTGQYDKDLTASFLFITKEGTCGAIQLRAPIRGGDFSTGAGYSGGGLQYKFIYEKDAESSSDGRGK